MKLLCMQAILTLFELATLDNWGDSLTACMSITGPASQPATNASWQNAFFYIFFVLVSANFIFKTFIGIFTDQVRCQSPAGHAVITTAGQAWMRACLEPHAEVSIHVAACELHLIKICVVADQVGRQLGTAAVSSPQPAPAGVVPAAASSIPRVCI